LAQRIVFATANDIDGGLLAAHQLANHLVDEAFFDECGESFGVFMGQPTLGPRRGRHFAVATVCSFRCFGTKYSYLLSRELPLTTAEKISIALPSEMVSIIRGAVATGEYASSSEVIRDALRDWKYKRSARQQGIAELRQLWKEAIHDKAPGVSAAEVLDRLERKYQAIAEAAGTK
jgi:antitoxin ParD1/3/4